MQTGSVNQPTLLTDVTMPVGSLHNILDFDGANDLLSHGADSNYDTNTFTTFAVVRGNTLSDDSSEALFWMAYTRVAGTNTDHASSVWGLGESATTKGWTGFARTSTGLHRSIRQDDSVDDRWYIISMVWNGPTGAINARFFDASQNLETGTDTTANADPSGHVRSRIGASSYSAPNLYFEGQLAELLVYNRVLTANEVLDIENYLNNKYFIYQGTIIFIK